MSEENLKVSFDGFPKSITAYRAIAASKMSHDILTTSKLKFLDTPIQLGLVEYDWGKGHGWPLELAIAVSVSMKPTTNAMQIKLLKSVILYAHKICHVILKANQTVLVLLDKYNRLLVW